MSDAWSEAIVEFEDLMPDLGMSTLDTELLLEYAKELQDIEVDRCNTLLAGDDERARTQRAEILVTRIEVLVGNYAGWEVDPYGDPRGAVVKIRIPGFGGNSFGGDGWHCVPTPYK